MWLRYLRLLCCAGLLLLAPAVGGQRGSEPRSPRVVKTKYGELRGFLRELPNKHLRPVEVSDES